MGAMVEAVARHGYAQTTMSELVALAGVSNTTFYKHFRSVEDCFLVTLDQLVADAGEDAGRAYRLKSDFTERRRGAFESHVDFLIADPAGTSLVLVDSLSLGEPGIARRQRSEEVFHQMHRQSFDQFPERGEVSDLTIRAINGGFRGIVYHFVRREELEQLRLHLEDLLQWGQGYQRPGGVSSLRLAAPTPNARGPNRTEDVMRWDEPPDSPRARSKLTQRERILRATAMVAAEKGYVSLGVPAITAAAGVSNQTFYKNFTSKGEAFGGALTILGERTLNHVAMAIEAEQGWVQRIRAGMQALLAYLAEDPQLARLLFIEVLSAGPMALDQVEVVMDRLTALFDPSGVPREVGEPPPEIIVKAIGAGIFSVIQYEVTRGRTETLAELAPEITFIILAPFGVSY